MSFRGSCDWPIRARRNDSRLLTRSLLRGPMRRVPVVRKYFLTEQTVTEILSGKVVTNALARYDLALAK